MFSDLLRPLFLFEEKCEGGEEEGSGEASSRNEEERFQAASEEGGDEHRVDGAGSLDEDQSGHYEGLFHQPPAINHGAQHLRWVVEEVGKSSLAGAAECGQWKWTGKLRRAKKSLQGWKWIVGH